MTEQTPSDEKTVSAAYTSIKGAMKISGLGRQTIYEAMRTGRLPASKCGRRTIIKIQDLMTWLTGLPPFEEKP